MLKVLQKAPQEKMIPLVEVPDKPLENIQDPYIAEITDELAGLVKICMKKRKDYSAEDNPFENFELSAAFTNIQPEQSIFARLSEKFIRLSNLLWEERKPENESIEDSLRDLALLSIILLVYRKRNGGA